MSHYVLKAGRSVTCIVKVLQSIDKKPTSSAEPKDKTFQRKIFFACFGFIGLFVATLNNAQTNEMRSKYVVEPSPNSVVYTIMIVNLIYSIHYSH